MSSETVVAVFDSQAQAERAIAGLTAAGIPATSIQHYAKDSEEYRAHHAGRAAAHEGGGFWAWLTGGSSGGSDAPVQHDVHDVYDRSIEHGGTVVTAVVDSAHSDKVVAVLEEFSPVDLDEQAAHVTTATTGAYAGAAAPAGTRAGAAGMHETTAYSPAAPGSVPSGRTDDRREEVMPLAEEQLQVGKRAVEGGSTRLRRYVVERPVEEQIGLRNETVKMFRRPATGTATAGADLFAEKSIEMRERHEEPVISKTAKVVEEVVLQRGVEERTETVRDTVRRHEVEDDTKAAGTRVPGE